MAWSLVTQTSGFVGTGSGTETASFPISVAEGDIVIVAAANDSGPPTDGFIATSGYTAAETSNPSPAGVVGFKVMGATPDTGVVLNQRFTTPSPYVIQVWRGGDASQPDASFVSSSGSGSNADPPSITTLTDDALVFAFLLLDDDDSASSSSEPTGFSNELFGDTGRGFTSGSATVGVASREIASAGAYNPATFSHSSDAWWSYTLALKPAASGPATITSTGAILTGAVTASGSGDVTLAPGNSEGSVTTPAVKALGYGTVLQATGGTGSVDYTIGGNAIDEADTASVTFSNVNAGTTTHSDLYVWYMTEGAVDSGGTTTTSLTVNGSPATKVEEVTSSFRGTISLWKIAHPGTSTVTVVPTFGTTVFRHGVQVFSADGVDSEDIDTGRDTGTVPTLTVDAKDGGVVFGGEYGSSGNAGNLQMDTVDWSFASASTFRVEHDDITADDATYDVSPAEQSTEERCFIVIALNPGAAGPDVATAGNVVLPAATVSGTASIAGGEVTSTGAATVGAVEASGTAEVERTASGSVTVPGAEVSGTAEREITSSGSVSTQPVDVSGDAARDVAGSGSITTGAVTVDGTAEREVTASGAVDTPATEVSGTAEREITGSGAVEAPAVEADGVATSGAVINATGSVTIAAIEASGSAEREETATGAVTVPGATVSGAGFIAKDATGSVETPAATVEGTAEREVTGSGSVTLPAAEVAGTAASAASGESSGAIVVGAVTVSGVANKEVKATGAITLPGVVVQGQDATRRRPGGGFWADTLPENVEAARSRKRKKRIEDERKQREALRRAYEEVTGEAEPQVAAVPQEVRQEVVEAAVTRIADDWQAPNFDFDAQFAKIEALFVQIEAEARQREQQEATRRRRERDAIAVLLMVA